MGQTEIIKWAIEIIIALLMMIGLTGCFQDRGWRFEIGVAPVSQMDNKVGLQHTATKTPEKEKY